MSKQKKKRNKPYRGADAATGPVVRRYTAVERSAFGEWWHDHKKMVKIVAIVAGIVVVAVLFVSEIIRLI